MQPSGRRAINFKAIGELFGKKIILADLGSESKNKCFNVFLYGKTHVSYIFHIKKLRV
jgi:hypothetical protein